MSSLADYLAKNYLTADPHPSKKPKKRKRKDASSAGLIIADDDATGWEAPRAGDDADDDDGRPIVTCAYLPTLRRTPQLMTAIFASLALGRVQIGRASCRER